MIVNEIKQIEDCGAGIRCRTVICRLRSDNIILVLFVGH